MLIPTAGGQTQLLAEGVFDDFGGLSWSPDGATLAFVRDQETSISPEVVVFDLRSRATTSLGDGSRFTWSPDGTKVAIVSNEWLMAELRIVSADGSTSWDLGQGNWPTWSPDGARVAFSRCIPEGQFEDVCWEVTDAQIIIAELDDLSERVLATVDNVSHLSWSADGSMLAISEIDESRYEPSSAGGTDPLDFGSQGRYWMRSRALDIETGAAVHRGDFRYGHAAVVGWSPDSTSYAVLTSPGVSVFGLVSAAPAAGPIAQCRAFAWRRSEIAICLDRVYEGGLRGGLYIRDLVAGTEVRLHDVDQGSTWALSPDGSRVAFTHWIEPVD